MATIYCWIYGISLIIVAPSTIGSCATIFNTPKVNNINKRLQYLGKVHTDILFGDFFALGGHWCALLLVDVSTRYCWLYGMYLLSSTSITSVLEKFKSDAGRPPHWFHYDFNRKLIGGNALRWILSNCSNIISAPAGRQSLNELAKCTWRTLIKMERSFVIEKQVGR